MRRQTAESALMKVSVCTHGESCTDCCWNWQYGCDGSGYPKIKWNKVNYIGHRLIWFITKGHWPPQLLLHTCDNIKCMNWNHHYEGDHKQNSKDAIDRGRIIRAKGNQFPQSKLNAGHVRQMRRLYASGFCGVHTGKRSGSWSYDELADVFHVGKSVVHRIINRIDWRHIN